MNSKTAGGGNIAQSCKGVYMEALKNFDGLKHGDKIISPIDNEVTEFYIDRDGEKYLADKTSIFQYFQFDPKDFYIYNGTKATGEKDNEFFRNGKP